MTHEQAQQILTTLKAAFPHADASLDPLQAKARDAVYRKALESWGAASAQEAVQSCMLTMRFYPTIAELYAAYTAAARSKPERTRAALPPAGGTIASVDEVRAACADAISRVNAHVSVTENRPRTFAGEPVAPAEDEAAMIQRSIARAAAEGGA